MMRRNIAKDTLFVWHYYDITITLSLCNIIYSYANIIILSSETAVCHLLLRSSVPPELLHAPCSAYIS